MSFDLDAAKQAIHRVKERSISPTTVRDLADLLTEAVAYVQTVETDAAALHGVLTNELQAGRHAVERAAAEVAAAEAARDAAIAREQQHVTIVELAALVEDAARRIEDFRAQRDDLQRQISTVMARTAEQQAAREQQTAQLLSELSDAEARDAAHVDVLQQIADRSWWDRAKSVIRP